MAIDFSDVAKPIDEKQLPNQAQVGLVDFSDVAKPIGTNESRNANQWRPANGTIFDQIDQQKLMYDPNLPDATTGRVFMAGVKDAFEGYAGGSAMEAAESRNIMGMTPEQIKAHLGEGARNSLMGDYALTKMENIDNNYIKNKEGIKAGIRDGIVDKATALAKMADPGDYNLPTSFLGQLGHDMLRSTPYSMMSAVPSIATGALTGGAALPTLIVSFLTSMGEASSEGGRTYMSMIEAGKSHDEAYAAASKNKDFNTLMLTLSNMISGQLFGSVPRGIDEVNFANLLKSQGKPMPELSKAGQFMSKAMQRPIISNIAKSPIKRGLVSLGSEFVMEGSEEMGQSVSDAVVRGEKINVPNLLYEGLVGGLSGAGQASVGIATDYAKNRDARKAYDDLLKTKGIIEDTKTATEQDGNNKVVADALSQFKGREHDVMFDAVQERNRILQTPLEERSVAEDRALPVLSEAVKLFSEGKVEDGLNRLAEGQIKFDFGEAQITRPQGPTRDVTMHPDETIGAIGEGPQLQEVARAEFDRLRSIPEDQRTAKDNQQLEMYRNIMEAYTAGNNVAGDLGTVAQRTVAGQPINLGSQQVRPIIPGRSFNNAQLAMVEQGTPMDRTYVGEPKPVNGGFVVNKPDGNAVFVPSAEIGGYYRVDRGTEQGQTSPPTAPQIPQTQQVQRGKKQKQPTTAPQVRDGVGVGDIYLQNQDGAKYTVKGFDVNNKVVLTDELNKPVRATPEQLVQNFERLSPERKPEVQPTTPIRTAVQPAPVQTTTNVGTQAQMPTLTQQIPQVVNGVGVGDIYQDSQGTAFEVKNVTDDRVTIADFKGQSITVKHDTLSSEKYTRLSPIHKHGVPLSAPIRTDAPGLIQTQQATQKQATQKQATQPTMPRTPEVARAAAKARTEKQARPTTEKTNTTTSAQTTTEQGQMARAETPQTTSESTTTKEVIKEDKVSKGAKKPQESAVKVGEKYKTKTGQVVVVQSVGDGKVTFDLETPGIMKPSPRSIEKFTENYKKIDDNANYSLETKTDKGKKPTLTAKDISSSVKGAKVEQLETGIIRMQFKNGFVLHVDPDSDAIVVDPDIVQRDYGRKLKPGEMAVGKAAVIGKEGFIRLVAGMTDVKAFSHELYHIAEKMVLTDEQIAIVRKAYGGVENRANAFADVAFKRQQAKSKLLTSIFQKIADFFADIRASIFGERAEDIFRSVSEGKAWEQKLKDATRNVTAVTKDGRKMWVVGIPFTDKYMVVYHGTHAQGIEAFSLDYVDTGEGAQMFGWGLYFTDRKGIAKKYKQDVSERHNQRLEAKTSDYMFDVLLGGEVFVPNNRWLELTSDIINQIVDNTKWRTKGLNAVTAEALNDVEEEIKRRINNAKDHIKWTEVALETRESLLEENLRQGHLSSGEETENNNIKTLKSDVDYAREKKQVAEKSLEGYERAYEWFKQNKNSITFRSRGTEGSLYTVEIPDDEGQYLYWDKPLNAQSDIVKAFLEENEDYIDAIPASLNSDIDETISTVTNRWNAVMEQLTGTDAYKIFIDKLGYDEGDFDYSESDGGHIYPRWDTSSVSDNIMSEGEQDLIDYINKAANALREQFPAESGQLESIAIYASRLVNNRQSSISRWGRIKGEDFYEALSIELGSEKEASLALNEAGIIGIKYLNGMSRSKGEGGYNYVIFSDKAIKIIEESYMLAEKDTTDTADTAKEKALKKLQKAVSLPSVLKIARRKQWKTNAELMTFLEDYVQEKALDVGIDYSVAWDEKASEADQQKLKQFLIGAVMADAEYAIKGNSNAIGWYDETVNKSMHILSTIHPELSTDPQARFMFTAALAVTSNGQKVNTNFKLANTAYEFYKENGQFPTNIGIGQTAKTINKGLGVLNQLVARFGIEDTHRLLTSNFTVGQLNKLGIEVSGELVDQWVIGAATLGPKVGNGFFANLNGIFSALTMDRWFMRTWGRLTGKLFNTSEEKIGNSEVRLQEALDAFIASRSGEEDIAEFKRLAFGKKRSKRVTLTGDGINIQALAKSIKNATTNALNRKEFEKTPEGRELRLAGNNLAGKINEEKLSPSGGKERKFIREIFNAVLENLQQGTLLDSYGNKIDVSKLTMSDLQAILWYAEKRLYDIAKVTDDIEGYEDSEAPNYANAAEKLALELGVSEDAIAKAKEEADNAYRTANAGQSNRETSGGTEETDGGRKGTATDAPEGFSRRERAKFLKRHIFLAERLKAASKQEAEGHSGRRNANVWILKRKGTGGTGSVRLVEATYTPKPALQAILDKSEISTPTINELTKTTENAQTFRDAIKAAKDSDLKHGAAVWLYEQSEYEDMRLFLSEDGKCGFALKPDGDIVSVFKVKEKEKADAQVDMRDRDNWGGVANWLLTIATSEGGTKLDCFDTILPAIYKVNGFKEVHREEWNEEQKAPDWKKENFADYKNGEPDVVYMEYDANYNPYEIEVEATPNEGYRIAGEESDSTFKAPPVTLRAIKRAVPGAKVSITKDGLVRIQFKNGFVVNVNLSAKAIEIDQNVMKRDYGREATAGDIAVGRNYVTVDGEAFIDIVSGMTDMRTFHHELYEVARRMALSGKQIDILNKAFKGNKEAEAEAYADFMVKRLANQSKLVNSLFQKISDFFSDIRAKLFGQNSEDIFRQIGDGKVAMGSNTMNNEAYRTDPRYRIVGIGDMQFNSPSEVTMVTEADKVAQQQSVRNLNYAPPATVNWKSAAGRGKKAQAAWRGATKGLEAVVEKREPKMTWKERLVYYKEYVMDNWIDNMDILKRTSDEKLYKKARGQVDGISSRAEKLLMYGDKKRGVKGLRQIFKGMSDEEARGFQHYISYVNATDVLAMSQQAMKDIANYERIVAWDKDALKQLRAMRPIDPEHAKQIARGIKGLTMHIEQLHRDIEHSTYYVREARGKADHYLLAIQQLDKLYPEWAGKQKELAKYTQNLLRINRDSGMIPAGLYEFLITNRPNYVPALRDFADEEGKVGLDAFIETRGFVNLKTPLERMHGSKRDIINPMDEIIINTFRTMALQAKQTVATDFIDFYEAKADGEKFLWRTSLGEAADENHFVFYIRRDGQKQYYATDSSALYEALTMRGAGGHSALEKVFKPAELMARMLRQATTRALRFVIRNPERDNFQAAIYGEGFIPFVTAFQGGIQVVGGGEWFQRFLEAGGAQGISTVDKNRQEDIKSDIMGKKFFRHKGPLGQLRNVWDLLGRLAEVSELSTRVGQFKKAVELGYSDEDAAFIARDLMNFGIGGSHAKALNRYVPFMTASIQDMNRFYRAHNKKNIAKTLRRAMMYITLPTIALWFWNNSDDDRKEYWDKLATWEKNSFWWIILNKDTAIPVAKPFSLGLVYGSLPERFMDYWLNNDRRAVEDFGKTLLAQTMPGYMPLALQLVMEWALNKSQFYGREIVPANEQKLEARYQYGPYTAEWAKAFGSLTGMSPRKVEYAVFGVTGSLGKEVSMVVDNIWRSVSGATRPERYITEYIPGSSAWISHGRNHMGPLYAWNLSFPKLEEAYRTAKRIYEDEGGAGLTNKQKLLIEFEPDVKAILKLNTAKDGIWKLQSAKNKITVAKDMTAQEKRKSIDRINAKIIMLSQVGLQKLDFFQDAIDSMEEKMNARR